MYDYNTQIAAFIKESFSPSTPEQANIKVTNTQLLYLLFNTFPKDCISDYELNDILVSLGYQRFAYEAEKMVDNVIEKELTIGWCLALIHWDLEVKNHPTI